MVYIHRFIPMIFQGVIKNLTLASNSPVALPDGSVTLTVDIENKPQAYSIPGI